jgi:hypothetical protein
MRLSGASSGMRIGGTSSACTFSSSRLTTKPSALAATVLPPATGT